MPKISVIVPVYKVEKYLNRCVDSILNQTFKDFELILVDDDSPDNSPKICDEYAAKDSRIKVIHKKNGGVSSARNEGIKLSGGEYLCFIDSDDYVDKTFLQTFIDNFDVDIDGVLVSVNRKFFQYKNGIIDFTSKNLSFEDSACFYGPCNFIYSRKKIIDNDIMFDKNVKFGEDTIFNYEYLRFCKKIKTTSKIVYYYTTNTEGATCSAQKNINDYLLQRTKAYEKFISTTGLISKQKEYYTINYAYDGFLYSVVHYKKHFKGKELLNLLKVTKNQFSIYAKRIERLLSKNQFSKKEVKQLRHEYIIFTLSPFNLNVFLAIRKIYYNLKKF